jgi:deoxyribonuclease IV
MADFPTLFLFLALTGGKGLIYIQTEFYPGNLRMRAFPYRLGVHVSIAGGIDKAVERALELGCSAMQIFSRNPRGWDASPLDLPRARLFREKVRRSTLDPVAVHTPYLLHLASAEGDLHRKSVRGLSQDLRRAEQLGARFLVTHLGSAGDRDNLSGRRQVVKGLRRVLEEDSPVVLLLENSAGGGRTVGAFLEEIAEIMARTGGGARIGFCFDSCHAYAAGYDFRSRQQSRALVKELGQTIGLDRLKVIHLNDCAGSLGSHRDRHQHIGKGEIGLEGFRSLLRQQPLAKIPLILETPKEGPADDRKNLSRVRALFPSG